MKEAVLWKAMPDKEVQCYLCYRMCRIKDGKRGYCRIRENQKGKLYALTYGKAIAAEVDPIEKKPFYHFMPGTELFSVATVGCNFRCQFCFHPDTVVIHNDEPSGIGQMFDEAEKTNQKEVRIPNSETISNEGEARRVSKVFSHEYAGELCGIKAAYLPGFECTPEHEIFVWGAKGPEKKAAAHISQGDWLVTPRLAFQNDRKILLRVANILSNRKTMVKKSRKANAGKLKLIMGLRGRGLSSREIGKIVGMHPTYLRKLMAIIRRDGITRGTFQYENDAIEKGGKTKFRSEKEWIPAELVLNEELAELLGYFAAEGHVSVSKKRPNSMNVVFSYAHQEKELVKRTVDLVRKIFLLEPTTRTRRTTITVEINKSSVGVLFKEMCGNGAGNKRVPEEIFKSPREVALSFLQAYVRGDGTETGNHISMDTISKKLAIGLCYLILKLGALPAFYKWVPKKERKIEGRRVNESTLYYVKVNTNIFGRELVGGEKKENFCQRGADFKATERHWLLPVKKTWKRKYVGPVYNMEVDDEHSYIANFVGVGNCQNWNISQAFGGITGEDLPPALIREICKGRNVPGAAYTYTEPTIFMEYALDTAKLLHKDGRFNTFVTNGYMTSAAIGEMAGRIDAARIDLKGFHDRVYKELCGDVKLEYVLESIRELHSKMHIELINLIIPGWNDDEGDIRAMSKWVYDLDPRIPVHFIGFYPANFMMDTPATELGTLRRAREIALQEGLHYAYTGNRQDEETESTYCPKCKTRVVRRFGFSVLENKVTKDGKCPECGEKLYFVNDIKEYWKSHPKRD